MCAPRGVREASVEGVLIGDPAAPVHLTPRGHFRQAEAVRANLGWVNILRSVINGAVIRGEIGKNLSTLGCVKVLRFSPSLC